jgi:hypothetical protein
MKIFLSWSGEVSHQIAKVLNDWLPCVLQGVNTFLSSDISKGDRWNDVLAEELKESQFGIICVTPFNIHKPWMNFEAGALSRVIDRAHVVPFLFHVNAEELGGPLSQFQSTVYQREDVRAMVRSLNSQMNPPVSSEILDRTFDKWWGDLNAQLQAIPLASGNETRTFYQWLYTRADLDVNSIDAEYETAWIITNEVERYFDQNMKEKVKAACRHGKKFRYFLPGYEEYEFTSELKALVNAYPENVAYKIFTKDEFENQAPSEYIILNPDGEGELRVLVKLPLGDYRQEEYWFRTDDRSARSFVTRFRKLWDTRPANAAAVLDLAPPPVDTSPDLRAVLHDVSPLPF